MIDRNGIGDDDVSRDIGAFVCFVAMGNVDVVVKAVAVAADAMAIPPMAVFRK